MRREVGKVISISGPVIRARGSRRVGMLEVVEVGDDLLIGEVISLDDDVATIQVYEETSGMWRAHQCLAQACRSRSSWDRVFWAASSMVFSDPCRPWNCGVAPSSGEG